MIKKETRNATGAASNIELRTSIDGTDSNVVSGYFAKFGTRSQDLGGFVETLAKGCFADSLRNNPDVLCLADHDSSKVLGRTSSNTLTVSEDGVGLAFRCQLPETSYANDLRILLKRGDITGCSFGFYTDDDRWEVLPDGTVLRTVLKATLFEGTITSMPAYLNTNANLTRSAALRNAPAAIRQRLGADKRASYQIIPDKPTPSYSLVSKVDDNGNVISSKIVPGRLTKLCEDNHEARMLYCRTCTSTVTSQRDAYNTMSCRCDDRSKRQWMCQRDECNGLYLDDDMFSDDAVEDVNEQDVESSRALLIDLINRRRLYI